jgi:DNA mismatch repair ATPase MutS
MLVNVEDAIRIVQKLLLGRGDSCDLASIHATIRVWDAIKQRFESEKKMERRERQNIYQDEWASIDALMSRMHNLRALSNRISEALHGNSTEDRFDAANVTTENGNAALLEPSPLSRLTWRYGQNKWAIKPE